MKCQFVRNGIVHSESEKEDDESMFSEISPTPAFRAFFWKSVLTWRIKSGRLSQEQPTPLVPMGYPNIQHSYPSCALWLFCAFRSQISHDVTQIKHNSGFFGLELSISFLNSYHSSRASARRSCLCVAVPFLLADLAFFFFLFLPLRPPWDLAFFVTRVVD